MYVSFSIFLFSVLASINPSIFYPVIFLNVAVPVGSRPDVLFLSTSTLLMCVCFSSCLHCVI